MSPPLSNKVRNLADIIGKHVKSPKKNNGKSHMVARKRSQRIRNRKLGPSNASCPIVLSRSPSPVPSPNTPVVSPPVSPLVPACDDDGQVPLGEVEYYDPSPNRMFGRGAPLGAKFGTLKSFYGPQVPRRLVKNTEQRETQPEPSKLPREADSPPSLPHDPSPQRSLPRQGNSQTSLPYSQSKSKSVVAGSSSNSQPRPVASTNSIRSQYNTPAVSEDDELGSEDDELEAPLLSTVQLPELGYRQSQSPHPDPPLSPEADVGGNDEAPPAVAPKSIRVKPARLPIEGAVPPRKKRGIVNNHKLGQELDQLGPDKRLRVEVGPDGKNPASAHVKSLLAHAVGSYVKAVLPMNVSSISQYDAKVWKQMLLHIGGSFEIGEQAWLKSLIFKMAANRFREWKSKCNRFYLDNPDDIPGEFADRRHEWDWLVTHFNDPAFKAKSNQMRKLREKEDRKTHHSGKLSFNYRAERHLKNGHKAAHLAACLEVYAADPNSAHLLDKMRKKLAELLNGETDLDALVDPMPLQTQMDIIDEIMDRRKEKVTPGPHKKIQAFLDIHEELEMTREELRKEQIEAAKKEEESRALIQSLADRVKALEDKSSGNAAGENA